MDQFTSAVKVSKSSYFSKGLAFATQQSIE